MKHDVTLQCAGFMSYIWFDFKNAVDMFCDKEKCLIVSSSRCKLAKTVQSHNFFCRTITLMIRMESLKRE